MYICAQCAQPPAHHKANNSKALQGIPAQPAAQLTIIKLRNHRCVSFCANAFVFRFWYALDFNAGNVPHFQQRFPVLWK